MINKSNEGQESGGRLAGVGNVRVWRGVAAGLLIVLAAAPLGAAEGSHAAHGTPGEPKTMKTKVLEAGAEVLQGEAPLGSIHAHLCGFHFYNGDMKRQVRADHYCAHLTDEVQQCVIYDSDKKDARLIGIEYIISERLFRELPAEEKKLWHSHRFEVKSGALVAPGLPEKAEKELMEKLVTTYGKTWHTWQVDRGDKLPLGVPQLMMAFTQEGQLDPNKLAVRDAALDVKTGEKKHRRAEIPSPAIVPGADAWESGEVIQLRAEKVQPKP